MLSELRIRNFALIDSLSVRLGPGLNVLTGETGAGKSIIVGALSLLLGERATADVVRSGAERATVEGLFDLTDRPALVARLDEQGIEVEEGLLLLKREVAVEGRNRAWINGSPTTAGMLGQVGAALVSLHGQHEHQTLLKRDEQRAILDAYAGNGESLRRVGDGFRALRGVRERIGSLDRLRSEGLQRAAHDLIGRHDGRFGGFGGAPKFPQPLTLDFLLRYWYRTADHEALYAVRHTLRCMARGGLHDQLGGGFHRYSVDARWLVPHFEKMLYDNALLARLYLHAHLASGEEEFRELAQRLGDHRRVRLCPPRDDGPRRRVLLRPGRGQRGGGGALLRLDTRRDR